MSQVLHWMSTRSLRDVCQLVFPCLIHASTLKVLEEVDKLTVDYRVPLTLLQHLTQLTRSLGHNMIRSCTAAPASSSDTRNNNNENDFVGQDGSSYRVSLLSSLSHVEKEVSQIHSFLQKFPQVDLNQVLLTKSNENTPSSSPQAHLLPNYIKIDGGGKSELSERIKLIFQKEITLNHLVDSSSEFKFGPPVKRVFVLKYNPTKPTNSNAELILPQRMACCLKNEEFLLTGTFSSKTDLG